jgi:hypothetical protein
MNIPPAQMPLLRVCGGVMVPTTDAAAIAEVVAHWVSTNPDLASRLDRAHTTALSDGILWDPDLLSHVVRSSDASRWYGVDLAGRSCSCPDHRDQYAPRGWCKHLLAVAILGAAELLMIRRGLAVPSSEAGYDWLALLSQAA